MNKHDELARITSTICEKLLLLVSVAKDMKSVEDRGLLTGPEYEEFIGTWGFDRKTLDSTLATTSILRM
jgi:hypothetical protein